MTTTVDKLKDQALKLPQAARAYLADALLESLELDDDFQVGPEWLAEARRRGREIDSGRGKTIPGSEALKQLRRGPSK